MPRDPTYVNRTNAAYPKYLNLATAAGFGFIEALRWLVDAGADVNQRPLTSGRSLLGDVCRDADADVARILIDAGARLNPEEATDAEALDHVRADWTGKMAPLFPDARAIRKKPSREVVSAVATRHLLRAIETGDHILFDEALRRKPNLAQWTFRYPELALEMAVLAGDARFVESLLGAGADPNKHRRAPPLHHAVESNRFDLVRLLLAAGADVEARDIEGRTPLMAAAARGDREAVRALLTAGAKKSARSGDTATAAQLAGINGHVELAQELDPSGKAAALGALRDGYLRERREEQLFEAVRRTDIPGVERLLAEGVDPRTMRHGEPLLHFAAQRDERIVDLLLAAGADPRAGVKAATAGTPDGTTALHYASKWGDDEAIRIARRLVAAGAQVDARDAKGTTPLAAGAASPGMVAALLELGANPNATDQEGRTVMMYGAEALRTLRGLRAESKQLDDREAPSITEDTERALRILRAHGAVDQPAQDAGALHEAIDRGKAAAVRRFIDAGADVDRRYGDRTPLSLAAQRGRTAIVKLLLERGADVNATEGDDGTTPLMRAAYDGHVAVVALLLAAGADPCATDELGRDALRQAREGARDAGEPRRPLIGSLTSAMAARGGAAGAWLARPLSAESKRAVSRVRAEIPFAEYALGDLLLLESTRVVELPARVGAAAKAGFRIAYTERAIADLDLRVESLERQLAEISASKGRR